MSDKQDKNIEQVAQETAAADDSLRESSDSPDDAPLPAPPAPEPGDLPPQYPPDPAPVSPKGSSAVAWLALLLVLALAGGAAWWWQQQQLKESAIDDRLQQLEVTAGTKQANLDELNDRWEARLRSGLGGLEGGIGALENGIAALRSESGGRSSQLEQSIQSLRSELAEQRAELARYSANDRESWLMAEAEYLLRLANQRLIMAGDAKAAQALLASADNVLMELDDVGLHQVRAAVAADLAAVRAVPRIDMEGIYLRLSALVEQADKLVIFELPEQEAQPQEGAADDWRARLRQGYEEALQKLSKYILIRRRDVPMQALMDPQWEGLVRQNLRMLLEQAQVALLSGNQSLYRESLQRAQYWVGEFFESDEAAARAMSREITQLADLNVAVTMPDISRSVRALDSAIKQRLQQGGGE